MVAVLAAADLPTSDLDDGAAVYFASEDGAAFGGLARYGDVGLLRSLVVPRERRGQGMGSALLLALVNQAQAFGVRDLWLLTTSAEAFFTRHGFQTTERAASPPAIASTSQFRDLCPASAALMHKRVA